MSQLFCTKDIASSNPSDTVASTPTTSEDKDEDVPQLVDYTSSADSDSDSDLPPLVLPSDSETDESSCLQAQKNYTEMPHIDSEESSDESYPCVCDFCDESDPNDDADYADDDDNDDDDEDDDEHYTEVGCWVGQDSDDEHTFVSHPIALPASSHSVSDVPVAMAHDIAAGLHMLVAPDYQQPAPVQEQQSSASYTGHLPVYENIFGDQPRSGPVRRGLIRALLASFFGENAQEQAATFGMDGTGDYAISEDHFQDIMNRLFQQAQQSGSPPASKEAIAKNVTHCKATQEIIGMTSKLFFNWKRQGRIVCRV